MDQEEHMSGAPVQKTRRKIVAMAGLVATAIGTNLALIKRASAQEVGPSPLARRARRCFLRGTAIRTAEGDCKVEDLAVGDLVPTRFGGMRSIQWIGRYCYRKGDAGKPWAKDVRPVRIARSALGPGTPRVDLYLSQLHALFIDGVLVRAGNLINGTTITLDAADEFDELEFFHIRLETHDVIYAEGAACETLLFDQNVGNFDEYAYRREATTTEEPPCVPLLSFNAPGGRLKSRFRSAISPWIDRRQKIDVVRDHLKERGIALGRQTTLPS